MRFGNSKMNPRQKSVRDRGRKSAKKTSELAKRKRRRGQLKNLVCHCRIVSKGKTFFCFECLPSPVGTEEDSLSQTAANYANGCFAGVTRNAQSPQARKQSDTRRKPWVGFLASEHFSLVGFSLLDFLKGRSAPKVDNSVRSSNVMGRNDISVRMESQLIERASVSR